MSLSLKQVNKRKSQLHKLPHKKNVSAPKSVKVKTTQKPWSKEEPLQAVVEPIKREVGNENKSWLQRVEIYPKLKIPIPSFLHQKEKS